MRGGGAGKRRDAAEPAIVDGLRKVGVRVWRVSGRGLPDLICRWQGRYYVGEVKSPKGTLTEAQTDETGESTFPVWHTFEDAWATITEGRR